MGKLKTAGVATAILVPVALLVLVATLLLATMLIDPEPPGQTDPQSWPFTERTVDGQVTTVQPEDLDR